MRILRALLVLTLGFWAGVAASGIALKHIFPSTGGDDDDELQLVAAFGGKALKSRSQAFRGGRLLSWFGGIAVDLREAQLAPDAHLDVHSLFGGIAIRVPPRWRVVVDVNALAGGVAVNVPEPDDPNAPTLTLAGFTAFGGIAVGAKKEGAPGTEHGAEQATGDATAPSAA